MSAPREEDVEATAEHARRWQAGLDTHPGEENVEALRSLAMVLDEFAEAAKAWPEPNRYTGEVAIGRIALARLEAEVARLSGERDKWHREALDWQQAKSEADDAWEEAVGERERLREALRDFAALDLYAMKHLADMDARAIDYADYAVLLKAQEAARAALSAGAESEGQDA